MISQLFYFGAMDGQKPPGGAGHPEKGGIQIPHPELHRYAVLFA